MRDDIFLRGFRWVYILVIFSALGYFTFWTLSHALTEYSIKRGLSIGGVFTNALVIDRNSAPADMAIQYTFTAVLVDGSIRHIDKWEDVDLISFYRLRNKNSIEVMYSPSDGNTSRIVDNQEYLALGVGGIFSLGILLYSGLKAFKLINKNLSSSTNELAP